MGPNLLKYLKVALSVAGSAILLFSCEESERGAASANNDKLMNEYSENLSIVMSQNGRRSYHSTRRSSKATCWVRSPIANSARV